MATLIFEVRVSVFLNIELGPFLIKTSFLLYFIYLFLNIIMLTVCARKIKYFEFQEEKQKKVLFSEIMKKN